MYIFINPRFDDKAKKILWIVFVIFVVVGLFLCGMTFYMALCT